MKSKAKKSKKTSQPWESSLFYDISLLIPCQFRMICSLLEIDVERVLQDFMSDLFNANHNTGTEEWIMIRDYFILSRYGQHHYTSSDIRLMIEELHTITSLWPKEADPDLFKKHVAWRNAYYRYWYEKWHRKYKRNDTQ